MDCKKKIYITIVISSVIIIALISIAAGPLVNKIRFSSQEIIKAKDTVFSYQERSEKYLKDIKDGYIEIEPKIQELNNAFINKEKPIDFIVFVESVAAATNNYQEIKEVSLPEKQEGVLYFQIYLWGSFPNLIKFLAQLENMNYFVNGNSLQINRIDEREILSLANKGITVSAGDVKSIINIKTYTR